MGLPKYRGMLGTVGTIAKEEGLASLWKGIVPGLHRQCLYGGLRIGLYEPVGFFNFNHYLYSLTLGSTAFGRALMGQKTEFFSPTQKGGTDTRSYLSFVQKTLMPFSSSSSKITLKRLSNPM